MHLRRGGRQARVVDRNWPTDLCQIFGHDDGMEHLHQSVLDVLAAAGYDLEDPAAVRRLQAQHAISGASVQDLAILSRRLARPSDLDHAREEGRHHRPSAGVIELDRIILRTLAPHLHETADWHAWHTRGDGLDLIASRARADPTVVRLVLLGVPGRQRGTDRAERLDRAGRLWRSGAAASEVAKGFGRSASWFRRARRSGQVALYPERLHTGDVADLAGVSVGRIATWARTGLLPAPEGIDGRPWWWEPTITAWIGAALPHRCPHCAARMPTLTGLRVHTSKKHLRGR